MPAVTKVLSAKTNQDRLCINVEVESLDASCSRQAKQEADVLCNSHAGEIEVDLAHVEFIDSSGVGALLYLVKKTKASGQRLKLCNIREPVRHVLELLRLQNVFFLP